MERLTDDEILLRSILFGIQCNFPPYCGDERTKEVKDLLSKVFDRLAEYEEKLADGRMVEIKYPVDTFIYYPFNKNEIIKCAIFGYYYESGYSEFIVDLHFSDDSEFVKLKDFNKLAKLTKADAEKALELECIQNDNR